MVLLTENRFSRVVIYINLSSLIGKGSHRKCYVHPENKDLCVKIIVNNGGIEESKREQSYYRLLEKRNISWEMLPRYYGVIESNLGHGAVFDLIRDYDGEISKTLEYYLSSSEMLELQCPCFLQAFYSLKKYLYKYKIITMDLKPENILYKKTSDKDGHLIIIDNIGNSDFIPVCNYVGYLATKKILRKWHRFEHHILHIYAYNKALQKMLTSSHR